MSKKEVWTVREIDNCKRKACCLIVENPDIKITELAKLIGVSYSSIKNWQKRGDLSWGSPYFLTRTFIDLQDAPELDF